MDESVQEQPVEHKLQNPITLIEHEFLCDNDKEFVIKTGVQFCDTPYESTPKYLGICPHKLRASYYIGAEWLNDEHAIVVTPKDSKYDYVEMFMCALDCNLSAKYFSKFYGVDFTDKPIKTTAFAALLTPLLIIHYISVVKDIVKRGLKNDYIIREENLQSKVKGKIKITQNIKYNNINKRNDRVYCQYQEYTVDTVENRVLKRALVLSKEYLVMIKNHSQYTQFASELNKLLSNFTSVSDCVELRELKGVKPNRIYKSYGEAIRIAKMILKRFSYSISKAHTLEDSVPPFWIDMSRLYEVYVYSKLLKVYGRDQIKFQVPGYRKSAVDFIKLDERVIIDTKYKPKYDGSNQGILPDVRQISAYARDIKILEHLVDNGTVPKCLIIYPEKAVGDISDAGVDVYCKVVECFCEEKILNDSYKINGFKDFYKLRVKLPLIKSNNT